MITLKDGSRSKPGQPGRLPRGTPDLPAEIDGTASMSA
jgi:hypothetical protein